MPKEGIPLLYGLPDREKNEFILSKRDEENLKEDFYYTLRDGDWGHCEYLLKEHPEFRDSFITPYNNETLVAAQQGFIQALRHHENPAYALKIQETFELFDPKFLQSPEVQEEVKGAILYAIHEDNLRQAKKLIEACEVSQEVLLGTHKEILILLLKQENHTAYSVQKIIDEFAISIDSQDKGLQNFFNHWVTNSPEDDVRSSFVEGFEKYNLLTKYNIPLAEETINYLKTSFIEMVSNFGYRDSSLFSLISKTQEIIHRFPIIQEFLADDYVLQSVQNYTKDEVVKYLQKEINYTEGSNIRGNKRSILNINKILQVKDLFQLPRDFLKDQGEIFLQAVDLRAIDLEDWMQLIRNFDISLTGLNTESLNSWFRDEIGKKIYEINRKLTASSYRDNKDIELILDEIKLLKDWKPDIFEGIQMSSPNLSVLIEDVSVNYEILEKKWKIYQEILGEKVPDFTLELEKLKEQLIKEGQFEFILSKIELFYPNVATPKDIYVILPQLKDEIRQQPERAKEIFDYALEVFGYNHLPYLGKSMLVFKKLFSLSALRNGIKSSKTSPELQEILQSDQPENCYEMLFNDLWHSQIESGTPDLQEYIVEFIRGKNLLKKEIANPSSLSLAEQSELDGLRRKMAVLISESKAKGKKQKEQEDRQQSKDKYKSYPANKLLRLIQVLEKGYAKKSGCNSAEEFRTYALAHFLTIFQLFG